MQMRLRFVLHTHVYIIYLGVYFFLKSKSVELCLSEKANEE